MSSSLEELVGFTNSKLVHERSSSQQIEESKKVTAETKSVAYIEDFWPHLCEVINCDSDQLGLAVNLIHNSEQILLKAEDLKNSYVEEKGGPGPRAANLKLGAILSSVALMEKSIAVASENWAHSLKINPKPRLSFTLRHKEFVSLRMLFPEKDKRDKIPKAEAPTLITGGTMTAVYLCWNLLLRSEQAYLEKFERQPTREIIENIWRDSRELIFRLGNGSLASFIALASACSSDSASMIWSGMKDTELTKEGNRFIWHANDNLEERYSRIFEKVIGAQNGSYSGCAALFSRAKALPLSEVWADQIDLRKEQNVFSELVRWITAVARKQYFSCFED